MNKQALRTNSPARVKVLPYPLEFTTAGWKLKTHPWTFSAYDHDVFNLRCEFGNWTIDLQHDWLDGFWSDPTAPNDGMRHGIIRLLGTIRLRRDKPALCTPYSRTKIEEIISEQEAQLATGPYWVRTVDTLVR